MSRTVKDRPWSLGGDKHKYWVTPTGHAKFTRQCHQMARTQAKRDLRRGVEPSPVYPVEREYFD